MGSEEADTLERTNLGQTQSDRIKTDPLHQKSREAVTLGFENLRICKKNMESCFKTKSESLLDTEKHKKEISTLRNKIANLTKDLNIKTERERQLALRLEALRLLNNKERYER